MKPNLVIVGQPNSGKSTIFNVLSDIKTSSSNFSGTSVEKTESDINIKGKIFHLVDLPGIYSLNPVDEAEKVTFKYLINQDIDLIINVVDSSLLSRSLELTVELMEFGIPLVIALNMWDETKRKGLKIYPEELEKKLGIPVVTTTALYGKGIKQLVERCYESLFEKKFTTGKLEYTHHIEKVVSETEMDLSKHEIKKNGSPRFYAIKAIENPEIVPDEIFKFISFNIEEARKQISEMHEKDSYETISYERHHISMKLMEDVSHFIDKKTIPFREKLDRYFLHPFFGYIPLLFFFFLFFFVIYFTGNLLSKLINIPLENIPGIYAGLKDSSQFLWLTVDGLYQGINGAIGIVLPYFFPLVLLMSLFEDLGYLSRIAFLMDGIMHRMGLHGKSVAPFIIGFGCSVPALYGTRVIENKRDRKLTALLIPFIPCSARTVVIIALTTAFAGPLWALSVYVFVALVVGVTGRLLSIFVGKPVGLILEIPDLKIPSISVSMNKTWMRIKEFLKYAVPFLIIGSIMLSWLEYFRVNTYINKLFSPILKSILGLPEVLGSILVFGFFRKELVLVMANNAFGVNSIDLLPLTTEQVMVFVIFVILYFPCLSTFIVMWKEFGKKLVFISMVLSVVVALISAFLLKILLTNIL